MKKFVSLLLSVIFLLSSLSMVSFADDSDELTNIAPNGIAYSTGEKNTLWTPAKALNDGKYSKDTWQGWECKYPDYFPGMDTSGGFKGDYCGVKFTNSKYYEIYEVKLNTGMHAAMGGQNVHYKVQFLVEGKWVDVFEFDDDDVTPINYESYEEAMAKDTSFYHIPASYSYKLPTPITTNNVRIHVSNYGVNYPGGDVLIFPYIYEIDLVGKLGKTPDLELPEGAEISTNIGYHSYPESSNSDSYSYPYLAIDGDVRTAWSPDKCREGDYLALMFTSPQKINKAVVNFGTYIAGMNYKSFEFDIEVLTGGEWKNVASGVSYTQGTDTLVSEYTFEPTVADGMRIKFKKAYSSLLEVYELEAHLSETETYYVPSRYSNYQQTSAAKGNIAVIGTPYASINKDPYSDVAYINDGKSAKDSPVWFSGVIDMPVHAGVRFHEMQKINKIAVYVDIPDVEGIDSMGLKIQALINGEYVTVAEGTSYHKAMKYTTVYDLEAPIETNDVRVVYTSGSGTFANLMELEIYSPDGVAPMFDGLLTKEKPPVYIDKLPEPEPEPEPEPGDGSGNADINDGEKDDNTVIIVCAVCAIAVLLGIGAAVCIYLKKRKAKNTEKENDNGKR